MIPTQWFRTEPILFWIMNWSTSVAGWVKDSGGCWYHWYQWFIRRQTLVTGKIELRRQFYFIEWLRWSAGGSRCDTILHFIFSNIINIKDLFRWLRSSAASREMVSWAANFSTINKTVPAHLSHAWWYNLINQIFLHFHPSFWSKSMNQFNK